MVRSRPNATANSTMALPRWRGRRVFMGVLSLEQLHFVRPEIAGAGSAATDQGRSHVLAAARARVRTAVAVAAVAHEAVTTLHADVAVEKEAGEGEDNIVVAVTDGNDHKAAAVALGSVVIHIFDSV